MNNLYEFYKKCMDNTQFRFDNRLKTNWFVEIDEMDPRGQAGPIYRPMMEDEFNDKILFDPVFKSEWIELLNLIEEITFA